MYNLLGKVPFVDLPLRLQGLHTALVDQVHKMKMRRGKHKIITYTRLNKLYMAIRVRKPEIQSY